MSHAIAGLVLVGHGVITSMIGGVAVTSPNAPAMALPAWFAWWPGPFGRSWLFDALSLGTPASIAGGLLWLASGVLVVAPSRSTSRSSSCCGVTSSRRAARPDPS